LIDTTGAEIQGCDRVPAPTWTDPATDTDGVTTISNATAVTLDFSKVPVRVPAVKVAGWCLWDAAQGGHAWLTASDFTPFDTYVASAIFPVGALTIAMSGRVSP
jgi:hypothetical protein